MQKKPFIWYLATTGIRHNSCLLIHSRNGLRWKTWECHFLYKIKGKITDFFFFSKFHFDYHTSIHVYFISFLEMVRMNNNLMTTGTQDTISACCHVWWYFHKYAIVSVFLMPKHLYLCRELDYDMEVYFKSLERYISITFKGICIVSDNIYFCIFYHQEKQTNRSLYNFTSNGLKCHHEACG